MSVDLIKQRLLAAYGHHEWTPRLAPLDELIATILSQHTSDINSERAFGVLKQRFPTWETVMDAPPEAVIEAVRSAGLANIKGPRLQQVLRTLHERHGSLELDFLRTMPMPEARAYLCTLGGVGKKTASCVQLFALGQPACPVDTHVHRVSQRLGLIGPKVSADQAHELLEALVAPEEVYDFHVNLIGHGRRVCHAQRPRCGACVLADQCAYRAAQRPSVPPEFGGPGGPESSTASSAPRIRGAGGTARRKSA